MKNPKFKNLVERVFCSERFQTFVFSAGESQSCSSDNKRLKASPKNAVDLEAQSEAQNVPITKKYEGHVMCGMRVSA